MEAYSSLFSLLRRELKRNKIPENFLRDFFFDENGKGSECYPIFKDEHGNLISKRGISKEILRKSKIVGIDIDIKRKADIFHECVHAKDVYRAVAAGRPNDYFADPVYKEIKANLYCLKRRLQEGVKKLFGKSL